MLGVSPLLLLPLVFLIGTIVGSFLALVADRWPRGEDCIALPSHCNACQRKLGPAQLIPLVSYVWQKGRCVWCGARIPHDLWLAELGGGIVAVIAATKGADPAGVSAFALFGWALVLLALLDARHLWLPDAVTLPLLASGLAASVVVQAPALWQRAAGAAVGWATLEALRLTYRHLRGRDGLGGGDPKLFGAIGAWLGIAALPTIMLLAALAGLGWAGLQATRGRPAGGTVPVALGTMLALAALVYIALNPQ
jgi:leader peptidase (prepilin peptidase)/N-methyltransferase